MSGTSAFPTAIDTFNNPGPGNSTDDPGYFLDVEISKLNDAAFSLETQVGVAGSFVSSTLDYILRHHTHQGIDNSAKIALLQAQSSGTDGTIFSLKNVAGGNLVGSSTATAGPTFAVAPPTGATVALLVYSVYSGTQTADLQQWTTNAAVPLAGVTAAGGLYTTGGFTSYKGVGGLAYRTGQPTLGEIDYINGAMLKGYSGALGTGQQYQMDMSQGALQLGGPTATAALTLNAWKVNRTSQIQMLGKDNADAGTMAWNVLTDADGQIAPQARTLQIGGQVGNHTTGVPLANEPFMSLSYPTYDGVSTFTKAAGISVIPGVVPFLAAGYLGLSGNLIASGGGTFQNGLSVIGTSGITGTLSVSGLLTASAGISAGSSRIQNVGTPTTGTDAPNTNYLVSNYQAIAGMSSYQTVAAMSSYTTTTGLATPTFTNVPLSGTWQNYAGVPFQYSKNLMGEVILKGLAQSGATNLVAGTSYTIGTLPVGYRPANLTTLGVMFSGSAASYISALCQITTSGVISLIAPAASTTGTGAQFVSFDGESFTTN